MTTKITFSTSGGGAVDAVQERIAKRQKQTTQEIQLTNREVQNLGRIQQQVLRSVESAQEKYNRQLRETKIGLIGHARETELVTRRTTQLKLEYARAGDADKKRGDQRKTFDAQRKTALNTEIAKLGELKRVSEELGDVQGKVLGPGRIGALKGMLAQIGGISGALTAASAAALLAARGGAEHLSGVGQTAITAAKAGGALAQLAGGDTKKLGRLFDVSRKSFAEGGFETLDEAHRLTFELESGGIIKDRPFLSRLAAASVDDAAAVAKNTSLVAAAFGRTESGNTEQLVSKGLAAAGPATGANLGDVLQGVAFASGSAQQLGLSDEEVFALVSQISEVTGSGTEAGTRANALFRAFVRKGYVDEKKKPLRELLGELKGKNFKPSELITELGRQEAAQAFAIAQDLPKFDTRLAEINAAQAGHLGARTVESAFSQPEVATRQITLAANASSQLAQTEKGLRRQRLDSENEKFRGQLYANLPGPLAYALDKLESLGDLIVPDAFQRDPINGGEPAAGTGDAVLDELARKLEDSKKIQSESKRIQQQQLDAFNGLARAIGRSSGFLVGTD